MCSCFSIKVFIDGRCAGVLSSQDEGREKRVEALWGHGHMVHDVPTRGCTGAFPATGQTTAPHAAFLHEE